MIGRITIWTEEMIQFLKDNYETMTNRQLADSLGLTLTVTRTKLYSMGMKRMEMEYWTAEQIEMLINNYRQIGDVELAEMFEVKYPKNKTWTKHQIEKKRRYLNLKRTDKELFQIHKRNLKNGRFAMCAIKRWETIGVFPEGETRTWHHVSGRPFKVIKINGQFIHLNRYLWELHFGSIPEGMNVSYKDNNPLNCTIDNLTLLTDSEVADKYLIVNPKELSDNYIAGIMTELQPGIRAELKKYPELLKIKRHQLKLRRQINELKKQTRTNERQAVSL